MAKPFTAAAHNEICLATSFLDMELIVVRIFALCAAYAIALRTSSGAVAIDQPFAAIAQTVFLLLPRDLNVNVSEAAFTMAIHTTASFRAETKIQTTLSTGIQFQTKRSRQLCEIVVWMGI